MPDVANSSRKLVMSRAVRRAVLGAVPLGLLCISGHAHAQIAGSTARPLPNVLLLVDTSGSMERMPDSSLPSANRNPVTGGTLAAGPFNKCSPGVASNPNRWGMLLQALTGNLQPWFSCNELDRAGAAFKNEFKINGKPVYDGNYILPYHRPLSGATAATACTRAPYALPGAADGTGVGPLKKGAGGDASDFPTNAFTEVYNAHLALQYAADAGLSLPANACTFEQATDGQLDAARDYVRFALMTFDNDTSAGIGVGTATPPGGGVDLANPFTGQWSYLKSPGNTTLSSTGTALGFGLPAGCATGATPYEVGARHGAAPPWEGRMVPFAAPSGDLFDLQTSNDTIQKVLLGSRPYGATPIEGMLEDARDYLLFNANGPNGASGDPYVAAGCRDQYIILLTDGGPNLDLRPACEGAGGQCPYNKAATIADKLANGATASSRVNTFVIGFSVNGAGNISFTNDGFPAAYDAASNKNNCKAWYTGVGGTPTKMRNECGLVKPPKGSTADACCELNEIAYWGTSLHDVGPFFAESQADLVLSFGRVLGGVSKTATTRTLPSYAPAVTISGVNTSASFIASFIPNARKVWAGEIDRTRSICDSGLPKVQTQDTIQGDSYSANLAAQSVAGKRLFISVKATATAAAAPAVGVVVDSARTIRPWAAATPTDGLSPFTGTELAAADDGMNSASNWAEALSIAPNAANGFSPSCPRSRGVQGGATIDIPPLKQDDCRDVIWDFATAKYGAIKPSGSMWNFNVRCSVAGDLATGSCSISGESCTVSDPAACQPPKGVVGEVCVPACAALGAIFHASPVIVGPPNAYSRDNAYQAFATARASRRPTMYVASGDGVLHAFKALATQSFDKGDFEMWAFVPPAVLPKLASNYPSGQQVLLDGTPVVRDTVWDRKPSDAVSADQFHSTLVAGMGAGGAGYYALNVSDPDCGGFASNPDACQGKFVAAITKPDAYAAKGPHFLWQLTDVESAGATDPAKKTRRSRDGTQMVALFGSQSGTPAITTLQVDPGDGNGARQIGVAILPGGLDGPPIRGGECARAIDLGVGYSAADYDFSDPAFPRRPKVRQWATPCATGPVPGRSVTIVRLDTGEVIRHFGRAKVDVPEKLLSKTKDTPFDSPIIGTPAVYPNIVGATAQKIFVGDADGTVWRIDVSAADPTTWKATLFQDLINTGLPAPTPTAAESQPIATPPVLSLDPAGGIVLNVSTGDQENIVVSSDKNYVYSIQEARPTAPNTPSNAKVRWYRAFSASERVTGPMVVFDRTLYFATFTPAVPSAVCTDGGGPTLWGLDYFNPSKAGIDQGGEPRWCKIGKVNAISGSCNSSADITQYESTTDLVAFDPSLKGAIIPGVTMQATQACASFDSTAGDPSLTSLTSTTYTLAFGATTARSSAAAATGTPQAARASLLRPLPRTTASIDAWALVVD